jgi:hypothetical protein
MNPIKTKVHRDYSRMLTFDTRVMFIHEQLYAHVWFLSQIFPPPKQYIRQLQTICARFLWEGDIFRVPLSNLHRPKQDGGWNLINVEAKCRTLFLCRTRQQLTNSESLTCQWINECGREASRHNPPCKEGIPANVGYLVQFHIDSACIDDQKVQESRSAYRKRMYRTMLYYNKANTELDVMRIQRLWPQQDWRGI